MKCCVKKVYPLHPGRLTWNVNMIVWKMIFLFNWVIFRFHVNLPGCKFAWPTKRNGLQLDSLKTEMD